MDAALFPVGTNSPSHGIAGLDAASHTAHKLKHSSAEHLHLTTRRFFIGPIPEGWLSSNRKSWYKRRLELSTYSSKAATFHAAAGQHQRHRTATGLDRSAAARLSFSLPQPPDAEDSASDRDTDAEETEEDDETWLDPRDIEPIATVDQDVLRHNEESCQSRANGPQIVQQDPPRPVIDGPSEVSASDNHLSPDASPLSKTQTATHNSNQTSITDTNRLSASDTRDPSFHQNGLGVQHDNVEAGSRTALLAPDRPTSKPPPKSRDGQKSLSRHEPMPESQQSNKAPIKRNESTGVRFKVTEAVVDRQRRVGRKAESAKNRVQRRVGRRQTLREGTVVKMEKMLVRFDVTLQQVPDDYDENDSIKMEIKSMEKWKEYMVVARKNRKQDDDDFRLQFYKTRVIPELDDDTNSKKPAREIRLIRKSTHVNLFSSLDKSVVIWHPYKKGTRMTVMKCESASHSVEWYTFLRDALGWRRPATLQVSVPDLGVSLQIEKPFESFETAGQDAEDEESAIARAVEAEQAVAGKITSQCLELLKDNPQWTSVLQRWQSGSKIGLAWKRYDRLEWIHGVNEQKMYGSMAMQHSYELELRPKVHYPQHAPGKKGKDHEEPAPLEGFLIRMTSQRGVHKRMGKTFFKRLYFSTHDHLLVFNRPAQSTPPHPPRLQTISDSDIPSTREIIEKTPMMYEVDPYPFDKEDQQIRWLHSGYQDRTNRNDREAFEEARRNHANLSASDGYINMTRVRIVRKMQWGADSVDETLESGSDVDFHESVRDTAMHDGTTSQIDSNRVFELILENGLVVRLQAYDNRSRDEWIKRLRELVKYWKLRKTADMNTFKAVRASNLLALNIDEDVEAELGQFGRKWEVTRSNASPELYNICSISDCRTISLSGLLYRKARRHGTFQRCSVVLAGGKMLIYQSTLRKRTGEQVPHIHQEKQQVIDLRGCYVYSGLIVEDDLLYQNQTFDANHMGTMASLPRVWTEDGWTSTDVDVMCCFVIWMNTRKGWFRTAGNSLFDGKDANADVDADNKIGGSRGNRRAKLKRVRQLGVPGRGMVFKCRSRAERDQWVLNLGIEIEKLVEQQRREDELAGEDDVRFAG